MRLFHEFASRIALAAIVCAGVVVAAGGSLLAKPDDEVKPKHTIKEIMKQTKGKDSLLAKVTSGEATDEEKKELLDFYISLVENKPKKGDMNSWHTLAGKAATAAAKVVVGREGAEKQLKEAMNCKACHDVHK